MSSRTATETALPYLKSLKCMLPKATVTERAACAMHACDELHIKAQIYPPKSLPSLFLSSEMSCQPPLEMLRPTTIFKQQLKTHHFQNHLTTHNHKPMHLHIVLFFISKHCIADYYNIVSL